MDTSFAFEKDVRQLDKNFNAEKTRLETALNSEKSARESADNTLQTNINNEANARATADNTLQTNINNEANARATADNNLSARLDALGFSKGDTKYFGQDNHGRITCIKLGKFVIAKLEISGGDIDLNGTYTNVIPVGYRPYTQIDHKWQSHTMWGVTAHDYTIHIYAKTDGTLQFSVESGEGVYINGTTIYLGWSMNGSYWF